MSRTSIIFAAAGLTGSLTYSAFAQADKTVTTKQVMKDHFKGDTSEIKKATKGELSKEQVAALLAAVKNLPGNKPSKGEEASWKEKSGALIAALEKLEKGDAGAGDAVKTAANCKACHDAHKSK